MATILVIDDDESMLELLRYGLTQAGHKVISATNAAAGMTIVAREKPDAITIDFCMPGDDGGKMLQRLRGNASTAATPVIFISSIDQSIIKTSFPKAVNIRFLPKPPDLAKLEAVIAELLTMPPPATVPFEAAPPVKQPPVAAPAAGSPARLAQLTAAQAPLGAAAAPQSTWKQRLARPKTTANFAAAAVAAIVFVTGAWFFALKPMLKLNEMRYESTLDVERLYGLQLRHKKAKGTYANDLVSLLALAQDGPALKADLVANVDLNTLAVVGDTRRFKIEINVLDGDRTAIKVTGPNPGRHPVVAPETMREAVPVSSDGAPIFPVGR